MIFHTHLRERKARVSPYPDGNLRFPRYLRFIIFSALLLCSTVIISPVLASGDATLTVHSLPDKAMVFLDDTWRGMTPVTIPNLPAGNHTLRISAARYEDTVQTISLTTGETRDLSISLNAIPVEGSARIESDPNGTQVYIDGIFRGTTPLVIDGLRKGPHTLMLKAERYLPYTTVITVVPGIVNPYHEYLTRSSLVGSIGVFSTPPDATLYLDRKPVGTTPVVIPVVETGNHTLLISREGYLNRTRTVTVTETGMLQLHEYLDPVPTNGMLILDSFPGGAGIFLNGSFKGATPLTVENLPAGSYNLTLKSSTCPDFTDTIEIYPGASLDFLADLANRQSIIRSAGDPVSAGPPGSPLLKRTYTYEVNGRTTTLELNIPEELYTYYKNQPHTVDSGGSYTGYAISDRDRPYLRDLLTALRDSSGSKSYAARNDFRNVIGFVQYIEYAKDSEVTGSESVEYPRYPVETLIDMKGDCEDSAILAAALLREMGYRTALILHQPSGQTGEGHATVGIACDTCNGYFFEVNGVKYYNLETTNIAPLGELDEKYRKSGSQVYPI